jgi:phosphoribosylamine--glycine ligase/phosphoribosylformylglycinamidine cyclo-ligase
MVKKDWKYCQWYILINVGELARTFNCGIGMVLVVNRADVPKVEDLFQKQGEVVYQIGEITPIGKEPVVMLNMETAWN